MMTTEPLCSGHTITLPIGKTIKFSYEIVQMLEFDDVIVVRLNVPSDEIFNENVYGISKSGKILWQVSKIGHVYENSPYTGMTQKDDNLILYNWDGLDVTISPSTGKLIEKKYGR